MPQGRDTRPTVLVVVALMAETRGVLTRLGVDPADDGAVLHPHLTARTWSVDTTDGVVHVVWNGDDTRFEVDAIGTQAAVATTFAAIDVHRPDLVLSCGTCGGFASRGGSIGATYLATEVRRHDRRVDVPRMHEMMLADEGVLDGSVVAAELGLGLGPVSTSDSLDAPPLDLERMDAVGAVAKEMEAAAVAWVCRHAGVAFQAVKVVTDLVDDPEPTPDQFLRNLAAAGERLGEIVPEVVAAFQRHGVA